MKTNIKYFWPFGCFRIEGRKQHHSDFQSHFSTSKIVGISLILTEEYKKGRPKAVATLKKGRPQECVQHISRDRVEKYALEIVIV
jgi:hypothetical protein